MPHKTPAPAPKSSRRVTAFSAFVPALVLLLFTSCSAVAGGAPAGTVRIYSSLPLSGSGGGDAQSVVNAIQMALAAHNGQAGGLKIAYISLNDSSTKTGDDGRWDADREQANARQAAADPATVAYIGTYDSGSAKVSIPILNRTQVAMISPADTYPGLTRTSAALAGEPYVYSPLGPDHRNFCRVVATDDVQGVAGATYAQKQLAAKSVYVLDDTELYGHGIATIFTAKAKDLGLQISGAGQILKGAASFGDVASNVVKANPDLVYFGGIAENNAAQLLKDLRAAGFKGIFMGPDGITDQAFTGAVGSNPGRVVATLVGLPPDKLTGAGAKWYADYKSRYKGEPGPYAQYGYESMNAVLLAIDHAGKSAGRDNAQGSTAGDRTIAARQAVLAALRGERNVAGITGTWSFDDNCDTSLTAISVVELQGGQAPKFAFKELAP